MKLRRSTTISWCFSMVAALSGGMLFSGCQTRFKDTIVGGTRDFFLSPQFAASVTQSIATGISDNTSLGQ